MSVRPNIVLVHGAWADGRSPSGRRSRRPRGRYRRSGRSRAAAGWPDEYRNTGPRDELRGHRSPPDDPPHGPAGHPRHVRASSAPPPVGPPPGHIALMRHRGRCVPHAYALIGMFTRNLESRPEAATIGNSASSTRIQGTPNDAPMFVNPVWLACKTLC